MRERKHQRARAQQYERECKWVRARAPAATALSDKCCVSSLCCALCSSLLSFIKFCRSLIFLVWPCSMASSSRPDANDGQFHPGGRGMARGGARCTTRPDVPGFAGEIIIGGLKEFLVSAFWGQTMLLWWKNGNVLLSGHTRVLLLSLSLREGHATSFFHLPNVPCVAWELGNRRSLSSSRVYGKVHSISQTIKISNLKIKPCLQRYLSYRTIKEGRKATQKKLPKEKKELNSTHTHWSASSCASGSEQEHHKK